MSAIANLAALLISNGCSADVVRQSLELAEEHASKVLECNASIVRQSYDVVRQSQVSAYDRKKSYDRERQSELRRNEKIVRQSYDSKTGDILTSLSSSLLTEETLKKERKKESSGIRARDASAVPDDWPGNYGDLFWQAYPRKEEKIAAMKKLAVLRKSGIVTFADLMAGVDRYCSVKREPQFIKQPTVWLNKGCWADETQTGARNVERSDDKPKTGHDAIFAAFARKARELAGDSPVAGAAGEDEFPLGDGSDPEPKDVSPGTFKRSSEAHDWRDSFSLEGEIIPPNKATVGIPNGRERR